MTATLLLLGLAFFLDLILWFNCLDQMGSFFQGVPVFPYVMAVPVGYPGFIDLTYWLSHLNRYIIAMNT